MKTIDELSKENADLKVRLERAEKTIDRLLAEPPRVVKEVVKEFVPYPVAPVPTPQIPVIPNPIYPQPIYPTPWWQIRPSFPYCGTITACVAPNPSWSSIIVSTNMAPASS
jgi:hypothetical protein